jgi:uncharacterized protein YprB with RNaseH-like and TPR domain
VAAGAGSGRAAGAQGEEAAGAGREGVSATGVGEAEGVSIRPIGIEEMLPGGVLDGPLGTVFVHERLRSSVERPQPGWGCLRRRRGRRRPWRGPGPEWLWADSEESNWGSGAQAEERGEEGGADGPPGAGEAEWERGGWSAADAIAFEEPPNREIERLMGVPFENVIFLDLETGGLSNACVFLAGTMRWVGDDFVLKQFFARHYGEEESLIRHLASYLGQAEAIVTFNGKSFDVPFLKERAIRHRLKIDFPSLHVDLLHHARAAWRGLVPNCRLVTLEAYVCRRRRSGDVPGDEIPGLYHEFVRSGEPHRLIPVFHHNLLDVITMYELLKRLI